MVDFDKAINCLMDLKHKDGRFSPYHKKALTKARKLCKKFDLEESWRKAISLRIYLHTRKVIQVLSSIDPNLSIVEQTVQANKKHNNLLDLSYIEIFDELRTGLFCKLVQTGVDSTLFAILFGYTRIKDTLSNQDAKTATSIRKRIITTIQHSDSIMNLSNVSWALCLWQQERAKFDQAFEQLANGKHESSDNDFSSHDCPNPMKSWKTLLQACINRLRGTDRKFVPKMDLPAFEIEEFYGESCRTTAYMFLNLKRISKLLESGCQDIYQKTFDTANQLFAWIEENTEKFYKNPFLLALYIECLLENGCVTKEQAISALVKSQPGQKPRGGGDINTITPEPKKEKRGWGWARKLSLILGIPLAILSIIWTFIQIRKYYNEDTSKTPSEQIETPKIETKTTQEGETDLTLQDNIVQQTMNESPGGVQVAGDVYVESSESHIYREMSPQIKEELISLSQKLREKYKDIDIKISVTSHKGTRVRHKVAEEIADIFATAGFEAKADLPIIRFTNDTSDVAIKYNASDTELAKDVHRVLDKLFKGTSFSGQKNANLQRGELQIIIAGDPLFSPDGIIRFQ